MGCGPSIRQTFNTLTMHTPLGTSQFELPFTFSTFDYRMLCELLYSAADVPFMRTTVKGRKGNTVHTDHGDLSAKVVVDCLGWQGVLRSDSRRPLVAPLSRGLEVHPAGSGDLLEVWIDRSLVPSGYAWSFPARDELRVGVGSYDPTYHVRAPTKRLARRVKVDEVNHKGNWIPHKLSSATEDGVFFVGDSAGHCLPLTAEGIRTAFYFGIACGREVAAVFNERATVDRALRRYEAFCQRHAFAFTWMLRVQRLMPRVHPRLLQLSLRAMNQRRFVNWGFNHYLNVAHPSFASIADYQKRAG